MKERKQWQGKCLVVILAIILSFGCAHPVKAETLKEIQQKKKQAEEEKRRAEDNLSSVQEDIEEISDEKAAIEEEIAELDELLVDLILEVNLMKADIEDKKEAISQAERDYEAALLREQQQQQAMALRIKYMYEKGNESYLELLIESKSIAEAVNKAEYTEKLYEYDRELLEQYVLAKQDVADTHARLENELNELEEMEADLEVQQSELNALIDEKQTTVDGFTAQLMNARARALEYEQQIKSQSDNLKRINEEEQAKIAEEARKRAEAEARRKAQEAARKKAEEDAKRSAAEAKNKSERSDNDDNQQDNSSENESGENDKPVEYEDSPEIEEKKESTPKPSATGSGRGTDIANYALQFVGNPYVAGGTSLTNGADCSGFTQSVFAHFGISIPRSSYSQSEGGTEVSIDNMQPGDILYYGGHVAIYIGNSQIVHASTPSTGIKVSSVYYRSIITVRRYY